MAPRPLGRTQGARPDSTDVGLAAHRATDWAAVDVMLEMVFGLLVESVEAVVVLTVVVVTQWFVFVVTEAALHSQE